MLHVGVDLIEVDRISRLRERYGERFKRRVYTDHEWDEGRRSAASLAARFAAKEAAIKALGARAIAYHEIEVLRLADGQPRLRLYGRARARATELGVEEMTISLSHTREHAMAMVVLRGRGPAGAVADG